MSMAAILKIKNLFKNGKGTQSEFKHSHYLNSLTPERLDEIILFSESDRVCELLPDFADKKILFLNDDKHKFVFKKILAREPKSFVNYLCVSAETRNQEAGYLTVFGDRKTLPFRQGAFDMIVCPLALQSWLFQAEHIKSISRLLKNGGRLILSTRHPQLEHLLFNQNPAESMVCEESLMKQFRLLRDHHLFMEDVSEGCVDLSLRPFFCMEGEYDFYHDYKGTPISVAYRVVKYVRGGD